MVVLFLTVMIAMILLRALRKDIANYNDASFLEGTYVQLLIIIISPFLLSHSVTYFIIDFSSNFFLSIFSDSAQQVSSFSVRFISYLLTLSLGASASKYVSHLDDHSVSLFSQNTSYVNTRVSVRSTKY